MAKQEFKFIKGKCAAGCPADICFYTDVDYWSVDDFLWELNHLTSYVNPSKIRIHINSAGGSCVDGISVFSKILDCPIPTECINDGLAASMGSIIWAAGDDVYMRDYALLMIHNPFTDCGDGCKEYNQVTEAFTQQLKTIYMKRFGLSEEEVKDIMDGKEGCDGTFFTAAQAVEKGFVSADNIIETPKAIRDKINAALDGVNDVSKIQAVLDLALPKFPSATMSSIEGITTKQANNIFNSSTKMENEITVFAALFGLTGEKATAENVTAQINEIKAKAEKADLLQKSLDETMAQLTKAQAELTGAQSSVKNLTSDLEQANASLKQYQEAEAAAAAAKVNALIEKAIADCKINKDEKDTYLKMAQNDYELAESVLAKIPARDSLGNIIAESNKNAAQQGTLTTEQEVQAKVNAIVGNDFKFHTLD